MLGHLKSQDSRRELYMVIGLIFTALTFSHTMAGWPAGFQSQQSASTSTAAPADSNTQQGSFMRDIPWANLLAGLPLIVVGILYYLGRRHGKAPAVPNTTESAEYWRKKWEDERGGSSARDQDIKHLKEQLQNAQSSSPSPLFHPGVLNMGMRLESALYGSGRKPPSPVTDKIAFAAATGIAEIPVNHYELCGGQDPDPGEDKFLTVVISTTIRQGDKFKLPLVWPITLPVLTASGTAPSLGPMPKIQQPKSNNKELAKEDVHLIVKPHPAGIISYLFNDTLDVLTGCCLTMTNFQEFSLRHKEFRRDHVGSRTLIRMGPIRSNKSSDGAYLVRFKNADQMILLVADEATGDGISRIELNTEGVWRFEFLVEAQSKTRKEECFLSWKPGEAPVLVSDPRRNT